ncbi:MAG: hypothetical protein CUN55_00615 [Phototrophicales bacterium]|nr:MAG: hypothetical protein CUN55_00615 [Phototrophicales bacterium]
MNLTIKRWITFLVLVAFLLPIGVWIAPTYGQQTITLPIGYLGSANESLARGLRLAIDEINAAGGVESSDGTIYNFDIEFAEVDPDNPDSVADALDSLPRVLAIFGPTDEALIEANISVLSSASAPVFLPTSRQDFNEQDANNNIFRIVAPEITHIQSLANYLVFELALSDIVLLQTPTDEPSNQFANFNTALNNFDTPPTQTLQVVDDVQLANAAVSIANLNPEAVIAVGEPESAIATLQLLREGGWDGLFVYPDIDMMLSFAQQEDFEFAPELLEGIIGTSSWSFSTPTTVGRTFVANFVAEFGTAPTALSVAGYDTMYALSILVRDGEINPTALKAGLAQLRLPNLVGGPISPALYGNRILSQTVYIVSLTGKGGTETLAIYDNGVQRAGISSGGPVAGGSSGGSSTSPSATPTLRPTATSAPPTATPSFLVATVNSNVAALNVRTGPGTIYAEQAKLRPGDQVTVVGRNQDYSWLFIQYDGQTGWVSAQFVTIFDPGGLYAILPIVPAPATPTPSPTPQPVEPDLIITNVTISPSNPQPSSPITATVTIKNQGLSNAGPFAVATSFRPGEVYTAQNVAGLPAGQTITVTLTNTVVQTGYVPDLAIIVDLNNQVAEGTAGESNNIFTVAYKVDRPVVVEATATLVGTQSIDFYGGTTDLTWDGSSFNMNSGALIGQLTGVDYLTSHYDQVASAATATSFANPQPAQIFAIITAEGNRGILRVDNRNGATIVITYRIYQ